MNPSPGNRKAQSTNLLVLDISERKGASERKKETERGGIERKRQREGKRNIE